MRCFLLLLISVFVLSSCVSGNQSCKGFEDMFASIPVNKNFNSFKLKKSATCSYRIYYKLENKAKEELVVEFFDGDYEYRLPFFEKKMEALAIKNEMPLAELLGGIRYKQKTFCNNVRSVVSLCESKDEYTSFKETDLYKVGFSQNRLDAIIKNRYYLTIYLFSPNKISYDVFEKKITPYFNQFNFKNLK